MQLVKRAHLDRRDDVLRHLCFAATEVRKATIEVPKGPRGRCLLGLPTSEMSSWTADIVWSGPAPAPGTEVCLQYVYGTTFYRFSCRILKRLSRTSCQLSLPHAIERDDRRILPRLDVSQFPGFEVRPISLAGDGPTYRLLDINIAGIAFETPDVRPLRVGFRFPADLMCLGLAPMAIDVEVRNLRPLPQGGWAVGCRFTSMQVQEAHDLARCLSAFRRSLRISG